GPLPVLRALLPLLFLLLSGPWPSAVDGSIDRVTPSCSGPCIFPCVWPLSVDGSIALASPATAASWSFLTLVVLGGWDYSSRLPVPLQPFPSADLRQPLRIRVFHVPFAPHGPTPTTQRGGSNPFDFS